MSPTTLSKLGRMPSLTTDLFEPVNFLRPRILGQDSDFFNWDIASRLPSVNIIENSKDFKIEMAAPGLQKKDFKVAVLNGMLTISTEKNEDIKTEYENYTTREFSYNAFSRSFRLPTNCIPDKIDAKYDNGILHLSIPKKEVTPPEKMTKEIKVL